MARSITTRSTNPKIMDGNIKILDDALASASTPPAENVSYDNTDSGLAADDVQGAIDEVVEKIDSSIIVSEVNFTTESINAGAVLDNAEYTIPAITDKTPIGVVGYRFTGSGYGSKVLLQSRVDDNKLIYSIKNTSGSAETASLYVYILCVNSAFIS